MLKIREINKITGKKIKLKELEKFGFIKKKNLYVKNVLELDDNIMYSDVPKITLEVYSNKESDYYRCIELCCGGIERQMTEIWYDNFNHELDTLYDLFEAGFIERI